MNKSTLVAVFLGAFAGSIVATTAATYSQSHTSSLADLTREKRDVSKMQWALLDARIRALEWTSIQDLSRPVSPANFEYNEKSKKIVVSAFVNPSWLAETNLDKVTQVFWGRAVDLCGLAATAALMDQGASGELDWKENCSIRFYTWAGDKFADRKEVAFFDNGKMELK